MNINHSFHNLLQRSAFAAAALATAGLVNVASPDTAKAQSFSCAHAQLPSELAICNDEELIVLDEKLSALFADVRVSVAHTNQVRSVSRSQETWLRERNLCKQDFECLRSSYRNRIKEMTPDRSL